MKNTSLATKVITGVLALTVVVYFAVQARRYFVNSDTTTLVYAYRAEETIAVNGFVARDESVIDCGDELVELTRAEGERVAAGKPLATVYRDARALAGARDLSALREQLAQLEYARSAALDTEAALRLDADLESDLVALRAAVDRENYTALDAGVSALKTTVLRREYAYHGATDLSGRIAELEARIDAASGAVSGASRIIFAPFAGTYSAVADGYESVLTPEALQTLTPSAFEALSPETPSTTVGKLIRGDTWYYAAVVDGAEAEPLAEGRRYQLSIAGVDAALPVTVSRLSHAQDGRCLVVLESDEHLAYLTMLRKQSAELILETHTGLRVPKNALRIGEEGQTGVYCLIGRQAYFKPVEILYQGEDYCLVEPGEIHAVRDSDYILFTLRAGDEVLVSSKDLYNGKVID